MNGSVHLNFQRFVGLACWSDGWHRCCHLRLVFVILFDSIGDLTDAVPIASLKSFIQFFSQAGQGLVVAVVVGSCNGDGGSGGGSSSTTGSDVDVSTVLSLGRRRRWLVDGSRTFTVVMVVLRLNGVEGSAILLRLLVLAVRSLRPVYLFVSLDATVVMYFVVLVSPFVELCAQLRLVFCFFFDFVQLLGLTNRFSVVSLNVRILNDSGRPACVGDTIH